MADPAPDPPSERPLTTHTTTTTTTLPTAPPASPPLPVRPTAQTPGPRAQRLNALYASSLSHTFGRVSWENFATCYPTIAAAAPNKLRSIRTTLISRMETLCNTEYERIMAARNVVPKLNELETLVSEAQRRKGESGEGPLPTPPHLQPPSAVLAAHMAPYLDAHATQLNTRLKETQTANAELAKEVAAQRAEMEAILAALERALADVEGAGQALEEGGLADELGRESRAVEAEMGMEGLERN